MRGNCTNHSDRDAQGVCHTCGRPFYAECLTEGVEYYYCPSRHRGPLLADDAPHQDPLDLLTAITDQIPNKGQHLVRCFGWYSDKSRGLRKRALLAATGPAPHNRSVTGESSLQGSLDTPWRKASRRTWARLIEKVYLVSPLVCPKCRSRMNIISVIEEPAVVRKILQPLGKRLHRIIQREAEG